MIVVLGYNVIPEKTHDFPASAHNHSVYSRVNELCDRVGTLYITETGAKTYVRVSRRSPNEPDERSPARSMSIPQVRSHITPQIHG